MTLLQKALQSNNPDSLDDYLGSCVAPELEPEPPMGDWDIQKECPTIPLDLVFV